MHPRCTRETHARDATEMQPRCNRDATEMQRAQEILRYYPDIEADPEAALFLTKAVADDLEKRVKQLQSELEQARSHVSLLPCVMRRGPASAVRMLKSAIRPPQARKDNEVALEKFIADQERAFEEREREGTDKLKATVQDLDEKVTPSSYPNPHPRPAPAAHGTHFRHVSGGHAREGGVLPDAGLRRAPARDRRDTARDRQGGGGARGRACAGEDGR